ncbi:MAG: SCP2 sterol-binding domain-containing protein [Bdellovibrionales bacterium]|nr:SCP2 sterol-binding domain-containing protein [Bdellovibrionales bacterium]
MTPEIIIEKWQAQLFGDPKIREHFSGTIGFEITGSPGGRWIYSPPSGTLERTSSGHSADCLISLGSEVFTSIVLGELSPQIAYLTGKLRVKGDVQIALQAYRFFELLKPEAVQSEIS